MKEEAKDYMTNGFVEVKSIEGVGLVAEFEEYNPVSFYDGEATGYVKETYRRVLRRDNEKWKENSWFGFF